jgi:prophage endopeptidase
MSPAQFQLAIKVLAALLMAAALIGAGFLGAWWVQDNRFTAKLASQETNHQADLSAIANAGAEQARQAIERQQQAERDLAALDAKATQEKTNALAQNEKLRADVAAGYRRLRIAGTCPAANDRTGSVPQTPGTAGLGDAATIELSPTAGHDVLDIRAGIIADQAALTTLQAYIKNVCLKN